MESARMGGCPMESARRERGENSGRGGDLDMAAMKGSVFQRIALSGAGHFAGACLGSEREKE
eukprot:559285-Pleurochrysis_carterae.AAC.1